VIRHVGVAKAKSRDSYHDSPSGEGAFPKGCLTIRIRDELGELFSDKDFAELVAARGRPGHSPTRLALVVVLQFVEGLADRQAADALRGGLDWKYTLGPELMSPAMCMRWQATLTESRSSLIYGCQHGNVR
jgi:transposase-like protein DUF772